MSKGTEPIWILIGFVVVVIVVFLVAALGGKFFVEILKGSRPVEPGTERVFDVMPKEINITDVDIRWTGSDITIEFNITAKTKKPVGVNITFDDMGLGAFDEVVYGEVNLMPSETKHIPTTNPPYHITVKGSFDRGYGYIPVRIRVYTEDGRLLKYASDVVEI